MTGVQTCALPICDDPVAVGPVLQVLVDDVVDKIVAGTRGRGVRRAHGRDAIGGKLRSKGAVRNPPVCVCRNGTPKFWVEASRRDTSTAKLDDFRYEVPDITGQILYRTNEIRDLPERSALTESLAAVGLAED